MPGDKSISHRALMFLALSKGTGRIQNLSSGADVLSTLSCLQTLGVPITQTGENQYTVTGTPRWTAPAAPLDCGNSGTTMRLMSGLLVGMGLGATLTGDQSLQKRPMARIITPLKQMGANIQALGHKADCAPLQIAPRTQALQGGHFALPMASAQVKSAILLSGLFLPREAPLTLTEPHPSRDHTERMLTALGATVTTNAEGITLVGRACDLESQDIDVPGDISSAAFWLVGAAILPGSQITLKNVSLNPSRLGILTVLEQAGANVTITQHAPALGEPCGDITLTAGPLVGDITINADLVPALVDEIPILTVLGLFTQGRFTLSGAEELKFKECDRLAAMVWIMTALGVDVTPSEDGYAFTGNPHWQVPSVSTPFETHHDHRLVMALEILSLKSATPLPILGKQWVAISYPGFYNTLGTLLAGAPTEDSANT